MPETLPSHRASIKETITQLVIAFVMAFVFRGFVVEAFLIPTGSMAPTLMGAHMRFRGKDSGYQWAVGPWNYTANSLGGTPTPVQGNELDPVVVNDPMTGTQIRGINYPIMGGDRIFVLKYLPSVFDPARFDCVVFKNPTNPDENYIKRLIGLPGEQVALIHGDVFVRDATDGVPVDWFAPGWHIARKPERVQRSLWMPVFSSEFSPLSSSEPPYWEPPWLGSDGFEVGRSPTYRYTGTGPGTLRWNHATHAIDDYYPYNQARQGGGFTGYHGARFLVPDVRLRAGVQPDAPGMDISAVITSCGHEFRAQIIGTTVGLSMRAVPTPDNPAMTEPGAWLEIGRGTLDTPLPVGRVTDIEFWHVDQSLHLYVNAELAAYAEYDWTPRERVLHATGRPLDEMLANQEAAWDALSDQLRRGVAFRPDLADHERAANIFTARDEYRFSTVRWEFSGPVTLSRVGLDRDLYYQADVYADVDQGTGRRHPLARRPARATHPDQACLLQPRQFFVCGDNSAASLDARLWGEPDPWIAATIDPTIGVVPRDLLIGKAFFVYFPAMHRERAVPMVDFGRMRFIW